ncbi:MAG TPA: Gfo/Idh/MocA family oxidoreductase [Natronoarchaeum rubrum]|nr:Gfo/Idh/MocA family oxidoreductase [Natronoarchaeum rubrum]
MSDPDRDAVRVGVVGLGGMGRIHAENVRDFDHEIRAGVDVAADTRESFERDFDARTYESHEEMYDREDLDAVIVTTPNKYHEPVAVGALENGLNVLVEKPLAHTLDSAERIAETAQAAEGFCMVGFHYRFSGASSMFKAYQRKGQFGEIKHIEANYVRRRGIPAPGSWFTNRELAGGGALLDLGVHAVDLALYLLDFPEVTEVVGETRSEFGADEQYADPDNWSSEWTVGSETFDVDDSVSAFLKCENGATVSLESAWATNRESIDEFTVRGTESGARFQMGEDDLTIFDTGLDGGDHYIDSEQTAHPEVTGWRAESKTFLDAVLAGQPPVQNSVEEGVQVQRVLDAIYESSERGDEHALRVSRE